jgi:hypothetical protein
MGWHRPSTPIKKNRKRLWLLWHAGYRFRIIGRAELQGLLRMALSHIVDVRDPIQRARDHIAARVELADA